MKGKINRITEFEGQHPKNDIGQVGPQDFRRGIVRAIEKIGLAV